MKKILTIILISMMILTIAVGCNRNEQQPEPNNGSNDIVENEEVEKIEENEDFEEIIENGTYVGQMDNNFIEIETENGYKSLMITDKVRSTIESIEENTSVEFTYYKNTNDQLIITDIKPLQKQVQDQDDEVHKIIGTITGQIDPTSIEVFVDGEPRTFVSYEMSQHLEGIEEGDKIEIQYIQENGGLMIQNLKKAE